MGSYTRLVLIWHRGDFIILLRKIFLRLFKWNSVLFTMYSKFPMWSPAINKNAKKVRALTGSTFGIYSRSRYRGTPSKQEPVGSLNMFKCTVLCNQTRRFIYLSAEALYGEFSYIEEKAVYVIFIHGKTVQWESYTILHCFKTVCLFCFLHISSQ